MQGSGTFLLKDPVGNIGRTMKNFVRAERLEDFQSMMPPCDRPKTETSLPGCLCIPHLVPDIDPTARAREPDDAAYLRSFAKHRSTAVVVMDEAY